MQILILPGQSGIWCRICRIDGSEKRKWRSRIVERNAKFDNLKLVLIYCVILGHLGNRYASKSGTLAVMQLWIYLFHMPAFVYISGLFSKRSIREGRWDKAVSYLLLYLFMEMLPVIKAVIAGGTFSVSVDLLHESGIAWYALGMMEWYAVTILARKVKPAYVLTLSLFLALAAGYISQIGSFLALKRGIVFFPIFYLGYLTDPDRILSWTKKPGVKIAAVMLLLVSLVLCFWKFELLSPWRLLFRAKSDYAAIETTLSARWGWLWRLLFYVISMALTGAWIAVVPAKKFFFSSLGAKTLPVYVFHQHLIKAFLAIPICKGFMKSPCLSPKCLLLALLVLLVSALPIFEIPLRYLMKIPHADRNDQKKS